VLKKDYYFILNGEFKNSSKRFTNVPDSHRTITRSMNTKGDYWGNAATESFFYDFKTEQIYRNKSVFKEQMERDIFEFIEILIIEEECVQQL